jgi:hypothetical protein
MILSVERYDLGWGSGNLVEATVSLLLNDRN